MASLVGLKMDGWPLIGASQLSDPVETTLHCLLLFYILKYYIGALGSLGENSSAIEECWFMKTELYIGEDITFHYGFSSVSLNDFSELFYF